jgi:site-specific recombinase XerC
MVDEVRILNSWLLKMSFIKTEDISNLAKTKKLKTISKKIKKEDIKQINEISTNRDRMMKYKPKAEQRLRLTDRN